MTEYLVIRLDEDADKPAHWIAVDSDGARLGPPVEGPLSAAGAAVGDRKVIVLVPGTEVLTTSVSLPVKTLAKIHAALPYALEESVAEDVETLHFAAGPRRDNDRIPVSVVSRAKISEWLALLHDAEIGPAAVYAENYGLARIPGTISMLIAGEQVFVNDGADIELVLQGVGPADALAAIGALDGNALAGAAEKSADSGAPRHVLVYCEPGDDEKYSREWIGLRHEFDSVDVKLLPDGVLPRLAATVAAGAGVNLLQGDFGPKTEYAALLRPWKYAALLLLAFAATGVTSKVLDYVRLGREEMALKEVFLEEYRELAPGTDDVRDPAAVITSLRSRTGGSQAPPVFLQSLEQLSRALQQNQEIRIENISYRSGIVDIRLSAPSVSVLDDIRRRIDESGTFKAEIQSTDQAGDIVSSRIQIRANSA